MPKAHFGKEDDNMGNESNRQTVECPFCHKQFNIPIQADKIPTHSNPKLISVKCPGSGCPLKE